ncbi:hypothetical protein B0H17DRAFT_939029, partial [Mycena rosella]
MKTPRKVQWLDTHDEGPEESTHALDEHGIDPNAFETLTTALERHRSTTPVPPAAATTPRIHYFPPLPATAALPRIDTTVPQPAEHMLSTVTTASSVGNSPPASPTATHAVPGAYISPLEADGLPGTADNDHATREAGRVVRAHTRK